MNYLWLASVIAALLSGGAGGTFIYRATVVASCGEHLADLDTSKCPKAIQNGFAAAGLKAAEKTIEYRDRTIPALVQDSTEDARRAALLRAQITELSELDRTNACASSTALRLRREQLCSSVGGADCSKPDKAAG